jgi:ssDNA-binding Zn-finger/Zn-ribbon topoisomerase 1
MTSNLCPSCKTAMTLRAGKFGEFYFCPEQAKCGQPTISKPQEISVTSCDPTNSVINTSSESLIYEMRILEAQESPLFQYSDDDEPFLDELGDPIYENGEEFRPHG